MCEARTAPRRITKDVYGCEVRNRVQVQQRRPVKEARAKVNNEEVDLHVLCMNVAAFTKIELDRFFVFVFFFFFFPPTRSAGRIIVEG